MVETYCVKRFTLNIQTRENRIRENIISQFVSIQHVHGKINLADIFTKDMKDTTHFVELQDMFMCPRLRGIAGYVYVS